VSGPATLLLPLPLILLGMAAAAAAQAPSRAQPVQVPEEAPPVRVVPAENVRVDYAQVLRVEPVYQTLRATRTEERCETTPVVEVSAPRTPRQESGGAFSRMVESVREFFTGDGGRGQDQAGAPAPAAATPSPREARCELVQVDRQFQRPIAYDVDYVYKGTKYRSRLAEDPGNRLRIRVSVTPLVSETQR